MPPAGGFEAIKYKRNLPFRGPSGLVILGGVTAVCAFGFYRLGQGNLEKRCVTSCHFVIRPPLCSLSLFAPPFPCFPFTFSLFGVLIIILMAVGVAGALVRKGD